MQIVSSASLNRDLKCHFLLRLNSGRTGVNNLRGTFEQVLELLFLLRLNSGRTGASSIQCIFELEVSFFVEIKLWENRCKQSPVHL